MEHYLHVFLESAWVASIIPLSSEPSFSAMKAFGGFNMMLAFALAVAGATVGQLFNWLIGQFLLKLKNNGTFKLPDQHYAYAAFMFNRYGVFLLFFSWAPLCNLIVVAAGFLGARPKIVLPLVIAGQIFNYGRYIL